MKFCSLSCMMNMVYFMIMFQLLSLGFQSQMTKQIPKPYNFKFDRLGVRFHNYSRIRKNSYVNLVQISTYRPGSLQESRIIICMLFSYITMLRGFNTDHKVYKQDHGLCSCKNLLLTRRRTGKLEVGLLVVLILTCSFTLGSIQSLLTRIDG